MLKKIVIFDGNHLAYRALYKFTNLKTLDGLRTSVVYGMPYVAESLIRRLDPDKVAVVFDGGRSKFRMDLLPSYKAREQKLGFDKDDFYRQREIGKEIFISLGLKVVHERYYEADDLIAMIARRYSKMEWNVIIVSGDKDFNQLIIPHDKGKAGPISIFNTTKGIIYNHTTLYDYVDYHPKQCVDYLAITGDKSDHIPGYPGIGHKRAIQLLTKYGRVKSFLESEDKFGKVDKEKLKEIWQLNKKLIDLKFFYRKFLLNKAIPWANPDGEFDMNKLKLLCGSNEINSFLKPQFLNTFKNI